MNSSNFSNRTTQLGNISLSCDYCLKISQSLSVRHGFPIVQGYIVPAVILVTVITNTLVIAVLLKKRMRTSTNILLAGLAFSDMMCGVFVFPMYFNFFTLKKYETFVQFEWCLPLKILIVFSTGFHTTSVFQTVTLAVQRYIFVCRPTSCTKLSVQATLKLVVILHIAGILVHVTNFVDNVYLPMDVMEGDLISKACYISYRDWVINNFKFYINAYFWFRAICLVVLPCAVLILLTGLLVKAITLGRKRRRKLFEGRVDSLGQQEKQNNRTTTMLVIVVGLFLICEIPNAVVMTIDAVEVALEIYSNTEAKLTAITIANMMILLTCPVNIFLYCGMSKQFRSTLKQIVVSKN